MLLQNINIENFRGIKKLNIPKFSDINLFVGNNNSGKTTLLEALFLTIGISVSELLQRINSFRDLLITSPEDLKLLFYNLDYKNIVKINSNFRNDFESRFLTISPSTYTENEFDKNNKAKNNYSGSSVSSSQNMINELVMEFNVHKNQKNTKGQSKFTFQTPNNIVLSDAKNYKEEYFGQYLLKDLNLSSNLENQLDQIILNKQKQEIIDVLQSIDPKITDLIFTSNRLINIDVGLQTYIPINLMGDGIRRIINIILAIYNSKDGIVLIDELENGFHYSVLVKLWKIVFDASRKFNVQLFLTTHSSDVIKSLITFIEKSDSDKNRISCTSLRKDEFDIVTPYMYEFDELKFTINNGYDLR